MKIKYIFALAFTLLFALNVSAQTNVGLFIKGDLNIKYNTREKPAGTKGVQDDYEINVNVANSALFRGKMTDRPQIMEGVFTKTVVQPRSLKYDISCDVVNPKNPSQSRNIGRMYGLVPITPTGVYDYDKGNLVVDILPMGNAGGFTSKFTGTAAGKPLTRPANWADQLRETVNINRIVNGKPMSVALKRYDKMDFRQVVLAQGPIQIYQPVTANGQMLYDYDKECWFFNSFTVQYAEGGLVKIDRVAGTIRYVKDKNYSANHLSQYEFDVRVNEPIADGGGAFSAPSDESAFFSSDASVPGLTGTMKYKDVVNGAGTTLSSAVAIDLNGNNINKQQLMVLAKVIIFASVIPMNAD
jgi:hypothetical protein